MCIWCNEKGRTFYSADAARKHMIDKGHCKMLHEGAALAEYTDFYDYSSSYPDSDKQVDVNEEVSVPELDGSEYQLVLPSGVTVGHRSLMRYYKQSVNPNTVVLHSSSTKKLHKVLACYRSLGWTEAKQEEVAKKARDIHYMKRMKAKFNLSLGVKANKLQKHFRPQVNF
jgi:pre-60S factor REI1